MIVVKIWAGLANKMFQYSLYLTLKNRGLKVCCDSKTYSPPLKREFEDSHLKKIFKNIEFDEVDCSYLKEKNYPLSQSVFDKLRRWIFKKFRFRIFFDKNYFFEDEYKFNPQIFCSGERYLVGFWQSEKYFIDIKEKILHAFEFPKITDEKNIALFKDISNTNSVAVHVRKGLDYKKKSVEGTCTVEYYKNCFELLKARVSNPKFYIFSDNFGWCKKNLSFFDAIYVDWNQNKGSMNYIDMQLMSNCSHNIIANSSYSWWAAWLNRNQKKLVLAPKNWYSSDSNLLDTDLIPKAWTRI